MHRAEEIVINTGPIIALAAALGDLRVLRMYRQVHVPFEVCQEILAGGPGQFAVSEFEAAPWLQRHPEPLRIAPILLNTLDKGEAAVIQLALEQNIQTVVIDEAAGRRAARLNGLKVTGSVGILLRARSEGHKFSMRKAIDRMTAQGIWLSDQVVAFALKKSRARR